MLLAMSRGFDAIVVGAGLGGLVASARLVREGRRVLVLERNAHPGGTAYAFNRKGYLFPMGPLGFSSPGLVREVLGDLGVERPELKRVHYRLRAFGLEAPLSLPISDMVRELKALFPDEAQGIESFFADVERLGRAMRGNADGAFERAAMASAAAYLAESIADERLQRILGSIGTHRPYTGMGLLAAMWSLMSVDGIWIPKGGMRELVHRLARAVEAEGREGEIRLGTGAAMIKVRGGRVASVVTTGGDLIECPAVISNADYKSTFLALMEPEDVPQPLLQAVFNARQTESNLQVSLGIEAAAADLSAFDEASRIIYRRHPDGGEAPDWSATEVNPQDLAGRQMEITLMSADDPSLAPEGGAVMVIRTAAEYAHFSRYRPAWKKRLPAYQDYKTRLGRALVGEAEKVAPGLERAIRVMDVATPLTFEERGGRSGGAVAGWSWDLEDSADFQPRELVRTPIAGLYMAGYQAFSSLFLGGVPTAVESGVRAARAVLEGLAPIDDILLPGVKT